MKFSKMAIKGLLTIVLLLIINNYVNAQRLELSGSQAQLDIRKAGNHSIRITLKPSSMSEDFPYTPALASEITYSDPVISIQEISHPLNKKIGNLNVQVFPEPLRVVVTNSKDKIIQEIVFLDNGNLAFKLDNHPVLGLGEGGPKMGKNWRNESIEFDRMGRLHNMEPRWQANAYGSRNPVALLAGTGGWGIFVATPWGQIDLSNKEQGIFIPRDVKGSESKQQTQKDQQKALGKGVPPADNVIPGAYDLFVFDATKPADFMSDLSYLTGKAVMPPKWALGYMQSHRTLEDDTQLLDIVKTFRSKKIPVDAVIYLGTGFCPRGWNTEQPSFDFNPEVFKHDSPSNTIDALHGLNVKVIAHIVPWDRDKLPGLLGNIPAKPGEIVDQSHILDYWQQHVNLVKSGIDGWWPDEGDWFNLFERIKRHQLYYQGPISTTPNLRPWSLHRNGFLGVAQWGGWVWSGDTESAWKTLEGQIAVGINHSLSLSPFWGSDIGGFYPDEELDGELYARWFQFGAFCPSFRSHGRTWWTRLPWGWGLSELGPIENKTNPLKSELNNPAIEPICREYDELRYKLMPYNYSLTWEACNTGMPLMRAMWLHYPDDNRAKGIGDQFLWGKDMLIAPIYTKNAKFRDVYLPEGKWYDWWTNKSEKGGKSIRKEVDLAIMPIYIKAGAIIPIDPIRQYTDEKVDGNTTLKIYSGADGNFTLYEDDGISNDYLIGKGETLTEFQWNDKDQKLIIKPGKGTGSSEIQTDRKFNIILLPDGETKTIEYTNKPAIVNFKK